MSFAMRGRLPGVIVLTGMLSWTAAAPGGPTAEAAPARTVCAGHTVHVVPAGMLAGFPIRRAEIRRGRSIVAAAEGA